MESGGGGEDEKEDVASSIPSSFDYISRVAKESSPVNAVSIFIPPSS